MRADKIVGGLFLILGIACGWNLYGPKLPMIVMIITTGMYLLIFQDDKNNI